MSNKNVLQVIGWGGVFAGLIWLVLAMQVFTGRDIFSGTFMDYLGVLAPLLILTAAIALILQGDHKILGPVILAIGSATLAIGVLLYNLALDPQEGLAFTMYFFGTLIQGLGLAATGYGFRARQVAPRLGTTILILGTVLLLAFPIWLFYDLGLGFNFQRFGHLIWGGIMVAQAVSWAVAGWLPAAEKSEFPDLEGAEHPV